VTVEISEKKTFPAILRRSRRHGNTHPKKRKRRNPRRGKGGASKSPAKARAAARRIRTKGCRPRKKLEPARMLSTCRPFPWSRPVWEGQKCVFNLVPCDNDFEREFAKFLDNATDVRAFSKLPRAFGFAIEYTDTVTNLKHYEPDFVAIDKAGTHWLLETKGQETIDVLRKDAAAVRWCENATACPAPNGNTSRSLRRSFKPYNRAAWPTPPHCKFSNYGRSATLGPSQLRGKDASARGRGVARTLNVKPAKLIEPVR